MQVAAPVTGAGYAGFIMNGARDAAHNKGRRVAVRVVSQFGEESTKVLSL